jgi:hypothetical protein
MVLGELFADALDLEPVEGVRHCGKEKGRRQMGGVLM